MDSPGMSCFRTRLLQLGATSVALAALSGRSRSRQSRAARRAQPASLEEKRCHGGSLIGFVWKSAHVYTHTHIYIYIYVYIVNPTSLHLQLGHDCLFSHQFHNFPIRWPSKAHGLRVSQGEGRVGFQSCLEAIGWDVAVPFYCRARGSSYLWPKGLIGNLLPPHWSREDLRAWPWKRLRLSALWVTVELPVWSRPWATHTGSGATELRLDPGWNNNWWTWRCRTALMVLNKGLVRVYLGEM